MKVADSGENLEVGSRAKHLVTSFHGHGHVLKTSICAARVTSQF